MSSSSEFGESVRFSAQKPARAPEKSSNFTQTCSMLSQYLKENGTFGDLSLGMTRNSDGNGMPETFPPQTATTTTTTMNLFPVAEKLSEVSGASTRNVAGICRNLSSMDLFPQQSGLAKEEVLKKLDSSVVNKPEPVTAQMTIFYSGQVIVFNDFPADKAKELMLLASNGGSQNLATFASTTPVQKPIEPTSLIPNSFSGAPYVGKNIIKERVQQPLQPVVTDLPKIARKASLGRFLEKRKDRITARAPYLTGDSTAFPQKPLPENKSWLGLSAQSPVQFEGQMQ